MIRIAALLAALNFSGEAFARDLSMPDAPKTYGNAQEIPAKLDPMGNLVTPIAEIPTFRLGAKGQAVKMGSPLNTSLGSKSGALAPRASGMGLPVKHELRDAVNGKKTRGADSGTPIRASQQLRQWDQRSQEEKRDAERQQFPSRL